MAESRGTLVVTVRNADCGKVLPGASIIMTCGKGSCTGITGEDGCVTFSVPTPSIANSYTSNPRERPYEAVNLRIVLPGYVTVSIVGEQIFPGEITRQTVMMGTLDRPATDGKPMELERVIVIPEHQLYTGDDAPQVNPSPNAERITSGRANSTAAPAVAVSKQGTLPETVRVHLGTPDTDAKTETVPLRYYIKNVACSELYPTWPEHVQRCNIAEQVAQTLNRIRNKRYHSQGYDFDITNSPLYDRQYVPERGLFDRTCNLVDDYFDNYGSGR